MSSEDAPEVSRAASERDADERTTGNDEASLPAGAPALLEDDEERRRRDRLRAALFGGPAPVETIGRFRLLSRLGAGGMGVVYAARDEQLGRDVAVKLLRSRGGGHKERDRLLREAQAMARLSHPNVVSVYEVGFHGESLFIAMEMVRGRTMSAWLREAKRPLPEVIAALTAAGRGLAAAHAAGLVHRDFKPENVMLGDDGAVKVLDFGLARRAEIAPDESENRPTHPAPSADEGETPPSEQGRGAAPVESARGSALSRRLTETGALLGTPAYMAPEQFAGEATDARTDQYAFCVSLYEALYGERPFGGETIPDLAASAREGALREPPPDSDVPAWLRAVVVRGLARDPASRWPSMEALLAALANDPVARRKRRARVGLAGVLAASAIVATALFSRGSAPPVCEGARAEIDAAWGDAARASVRKGLTKGGEPFAPDAADRAIKIVDKYAESWAAMHRDACLANVRKEQSSELLDLRMACLRRRRAEVEALAKVLSEGAPGTATRAVTAADSLPPLALCADAEALRAQVKPPSDPATLASVQAVRAALIDASADENTGQYTRELERATKAVADAEKTGYRPVLAEALYQQGIAQISLSAHQDAAKTLERAYYEALATKQDEVAAHVSQSLFTVLGYHLSKTEASAPWERAAEAHVARLEGRKVLRADFLNTRGLVRAEAHALDGAAADYAEALAIYEAELGPSHHKVALVLSNMAQVSYLRDRYAESASQLERALTIREATLGPDHPDLVATLNNLSMVVRAQGKPERAVELLQRALAVQERSFGKDHLSVAPVLNNLGRSLKALERAAEAVPLHRRALAILLANPSANPTRIATTEEDLGVSLLELDHADEAARLFESALTRRRAAYAKPHANTAGALLYLGEARLAQGKLDEAIALMRESLAMMEAALGPDDGDVAEVLIELGDALLKKRDVPGATAALTRALAIRTSKEGSRASLGAARWGLAKVLLEGAKKEDRARAAELASLAVADYRSMGDARRKTVAEIEAWASAAGLTLTGR